MFVKLALSFESLHKSWGRVEEFGVCGSGDAEEKKEKRKINTLSTFLLGFITLPIPREPQLRRVNSYRVRGKKHINWDLSIFWVLTPPFKSRISKGWGRESRLLCECARGLCLRSPFAAAKSFIMMFSIWKEANTSCSFEKLSGVFCGLIFARLGIYSWC